MIKTQKFLLIIGNARSGSTILGAVLDAHPNMVVANETIESGHLWRGLDGGKILAGIFQNAEQQALESTRSAVCGQKSAWPPSKKQDIRVVGDKIWNPATLFLHGKYNLIPSLEERVVAPVALIHACRNPFDAISSMHLKSGAPVGDRIRWYSVHCEAVAAISERMPGNRFLHVHHEELIQRPSVVLANCCRFLDVPFSDAYLERCKPLLLGVPRQTRRQVEWTALEIDRVRELMDSFHWLERYRKESSPTVSMKSP
jgi:hypothetical protein